MYTSVSEELISRAFRIGEILAEFGMTKWNSDFSLHAFFNVWGIILSTLTLIGWAFKS